MFILHVTFHTLGTEPTLIEWEVLPWLKTDHAVALHLELNAALLAAKAAMGLYDTIWLNLRVPACGRDSVQGRPELGHQLGNFYWWFGHKFSFAGRETRVPCSRHLPSCAMASDLRRHAGHTS